MASSLSNRLYGRARPDAVVIIGAGLTGLMCALHLARRGYDIAIYERRSREEIARPGYEVLGKKGRSMSMDISARGIYALKAVGVFDEVRAISVPMIYRVIHGDDDEQRFLPYGRFEHECILTVSRTRLYQALLDACCRFSNIAISFGQRLAGIDFSCRSASLIDEGTGGVTEIFPKVVIGTDGVNSTVRGLIQERGGRFFISSFPMSYKELSIPADHASDFYLKAMHMWPRYDMMLVAQPNLDRSFTCALLMREDGAQRSFGNIGSEGIRDVFDRCFRDASLRMPDLEKEYQKHPIGQLKVITSQAFSFGDFALLLGDAAHAMVPFFGQGVNCCFEDVTFLMDCLDAFDGDWQRAFARIDEARVGEANAINALSYENYPELFAKTDLSRILLIKEIEAALTIRFPNTFHSYHNLICFDRVPYSMAQRIKIIQNHLLERLSVGVRSVQELDRQKLEREMADHRQRLDLIRREYS